MEFQVYSVSLEDRYPHALPKDKTKESLFEEGFFHSVKGVNVEKGKQGCVAFLFGRDGGGRSVCTRIEGVCPKLYYAIQEGDTLQSIRQELEVEVAGQLYGGSIRVEAKQFAHDYGYEFDPSSPSGRKVHLYAQASYPSLVSWRLACKIRRRDMYNSVRKRIQCAESEVACLQQSRMDIRQQMMTSSSDIELLRAEYVTKEERENHLKNELIVGLKRREEMLCDGDFEETTSTHTRFAHEYFVDPLTRFFQESNITPSTWIRVPFHMTEERVTICDHELLVDMRSVQPVQNDMNAPYTVLYYDIETLGLNPLEKPVIQISMVFVQNENRKKHLVAIGSLDLIQDVVIHECENEVELLQRFRILVLQYDPDFVVAYNGVNFDNNFIATRATRGHASLLKDVDEFWYLSRFALRPSRLRELRLTSSGMGDNLLRYIDMPGRANLDWFIKLKRDLTSEPAYNLNHFAKKLCGMQKDDMDYKEIPILHAGSSTDRARLGKYCVIDSDLLEDINQARTMIVEILQFSAVFGVLAEWVYFRGQQVRYIAILLKKARSAESVPLLLNRPHGGFCGEGVSTYEGATVNQPKVGFYKQPVATLDWMSLYPSIMRAYNLCHSTHVLDPSMFGEEGVVEYRINDKFIAHFVTSDRHKGILPAILEELHSERNNAKKKVKEYVIQSKDPSLSDSEKARALTLSKIWDGRQLALKISMNSVYGACGATDTGKFPDLAVSAVVTLKGRDAMVVKKRILPERFPGIDIVYGDTDSVMVTFHEVYDVPTCGKLGEMAADFVTDYFSKSGFPQMKLEFEKCYLPYLLEGKKRYAGLKYEMGGDNEMVCKGIDCKGIETERRDTLPFVKDIIRGSLDILMYQLDEHKAVQFYMEKMNTFINGEVEFEKFIMRKNLSAKVEHRTDTIVQARVNALRRQREPGSEAAINEQVDYVIINGHKKEKTTQLAEDPVYARKMGLKLNLLWYFEHAIREPVKKLFSSFDTIDITQVNSQITAQLDGKRLGVESNALKGMLVVGGGSTSQQRVAPRQIVKRKKK